MFLIIDAIQEFNIQTNGVSAEFGRFDVGHQSTTRAGSNEFHGSMWEFFRNEALNSRNYFARPPQKKPEFGATNTERRSADRSSGIAPFFFVDYQGVKQAIGTVRTSTVPTLLERQGNFTELYGDTTAVLFDPDTTVPDGTSFSPSPFSPTNVIPIDRIDPAALNVLNRYPLPTKSGTANNFTLVGNDEDHQNQFDGRLDHNSSVTNQVFGRYSYFHDVDQPVPFLPDGSGNITTGVIGLTDTLGEQVVGSYTHTFNERTLNNFKFG